MSIRRGGFILLAVLRLAAFTGPAAAQSAPVYDPANGHWYQAVLVAGGISWPQARIAAATASYAGYSGHLLTLTAPEENQFVLANLPLSASGQWWIGAYQDRSAPDYSEPTGGWRWVTGEPWSYTNWIYNQPDNYQGDQDNADIDTRYGDEWDDRNDADSQGGYLVEYEPQPVASPTPAPDGAAQLALFPNPALGGEPALGQVALSVPAGPGGLLITLTSSSPAVAAVPASLSVPAGASSATFVIGTAPVRASVAVTVTARSAEGQSSASFWVLPLSSPPSPAPPFAPANLLVNGSFEEPHITDGSSNWNLRPDQLPGWRITRGDVDVVQSWQPAPGQGTQSLDLAGNQSGTIEQSFPTVPGQVYLFSGWVAHNNGSPYGRADVLLNGAFFTELYHDIPSSDAAMHWVSFAFSFRATTPLTTLTLEDVTGLDPRRGTALDGLSVTLAPDPSPPPVGT